MRTCLVYRWLQQQIGEGKLSGHSNVAETTGAAIGIAASTVNSILDEATASSSRESTLSRAKKCLERASWTMSNARSDSGTPRSRPSPRR